MLVSEISTRVKRQFGDEAGAQITDQDVLRWINDAQREIAHNNDLLQSVATTGCVSGQDQYTTPPNVLNLQIVRFRKQKLQHMTLEEATTFTSEENSGVPTHYTAWGRRLDLYPTPDITDTTAIQLYYTREPNIVKLLTDEPEVPIQYHNRIVEYCIAQAYELDADMESYQVKMGQFQDGMDRLKANSDWQPQNVYPSITMSHDDMDMGGGYFYGER